MSLSNLFKKASAIFTGPNAGETSRQPFYHDGETIFCKNNVCVHPASILREDYDLVHHPGYLTINYTSTRSVPGLHLVWVPNTSIHKTYQNKRSKSLNRYDTTDSPCESPQVTRRPRCLSHVRSDSLESQCSGCSPNIDNDSLGSIDSTNELASGLGETSNNLPNATAASTTNLPNSHNGENVNNNRKLVNAMTKTDSESADRSTDAITNTSTNTKNDNVQCTNEINTISNKCNLISDGASETENVISKVKSDLRNEIKNQNGSVPKPECKNSHTNGNINSTKPTQCHITSIKNVNCQQTCQSPSKTNRDSFETNIDTLTNDVSETVEIPSDSEISKHVSIDERETSKDSSIDEDSRTNGSLDEMNTVQGITHRCDELIDRLTHDMNGDCHKNARETNHNKISHILIPTNSIDEEDTEEVEVFNIQSINNKKADPNKNNTNRITNVINNRKNDNSFPLGGDGANNCVDPCGTKIEITKPANQPLWSNAESVADGHHLNFPDSPSFSNQSLPCSPYFSRNKKTCKKFSIDLNEMKSLRLFFCDAAKTKGQFVIASRESQYKILHFHHGGLNKLATLLNEWNFVKSRSNQLGEVLPYEHFMVYQPCVPDTELHPDENSFPDHIDILSFFNAAGQIEDEFSFRKYIFFNGVPPKHRSLVWPFLLNYYAYNSTATERSALVAIKRAEYASISQSRRGLDAETLEEFVRGIESVVEKDVVRTDRGNPFYAGEGNPHVETMKNILLNYAVYDAGLGYTQGMSDLLAPVLAEIRVESDAFWCFTGLLRRGLFVCTPTDSDMEQNLNYFRELIRIMEPAFYEHLTRHIDAMELLFCHRWILLCFKREFQTESALTIWESCWSSYATEYFHLFVCLAIVSIYGKDVVAQNLRTDEMLLHFSSLANYMDAKLILRKARGLVHNFRQLPVIPCTLVRLCQQCGPGIWDSSHVPNVECQGQDACECNCRTTE